MSASCQKRTFALQQNFLIRCWSWAANSAIAIRILITNPPAPSTGTSHIIDRSMLTRPSEPITEDSKADIGIPSFAAVGAPGAPGLQSPHIRNEMRYQEALGLYCVARCVLFFILRNMRASTSDELDRVLVFGDVPHRPVTARMQFRRLQYRQIGRLLALENPAGEDADLAVRI